MTNIMIYKGKWTEKKVYKERVRVKNEMIVQWFGRKEEGKKRES